MPCGNVQVQVKVQGNTRMVDTLPTTSAAQLDCIVAARVGVPHGSFALYRGSKRLLGNEPVGELVYGIELKFRGRGGMPTPRQLSSDVAAGAPAASPTKLRAEVGAAAAAHAEPLSPEDGTMGAIVVDLGTSEAKMLLLLGSEAVEVRELAITRESSLEAAQKLAAGTGEKQSLSFDAYA